MPNTLLTCWRKEDSKRNRRESALKRCHGNKLLTGQALLDLYNKSRDSEIRQKARADALHFFSLCKGNNG